MLAEFFSPPRYAEDEATMAEVQARILSYPVSTDQAEEVAVLAGLLPALRRGVERGEAAGLRGRLEREGLKTAGFEGTRGAWVLAAREAEALRRAVELSEALDRGDEVTGAEVGEALGRPGCCAEASRRAPDRWDIHRLLATCGELSLAHDPWLNVLDREIFRLIFWAPCSLVCGPSLAFARRLERLLEPQARSFLRGLRRELSGVRVVLHEQVQLSIEGQIEGEGCLPRLVVPSARARQGGLAAGAEAEVARALLEARGARKIDENEGRLWLDGEPWARGTLVRFQG